MKNDPCTFQFDVFYHQRSEACFGGTLKPVNPEHIDNLRQISECFDCRHVFNDITQSRIWGWALEVELYFQQTQPTCRSIKELREWSHPDEKHEQKRGTYCPLQTVGCPFTRHKLLRAMHESIWWVCLCHRADLHSTKSCCILWRIQITGTKAIKGRSWIYDGRNTMNADAVCQLVGWVGVSVKGWMSLKMWWTAKKRRPKTVERGVSAPPSSEYQVRECLVRRLVVHPSSVMMMHHLHRFRASVISGEQHAIKALSPPSAPSLPPFWTAHRWKLHFFY